MRILLDAGAQVENFAEKNQFTSLMFAVMGGNKEIAKMLTEKKHNLHTKCPYGKTAAHYACKPGRLPILKILVKYDNSLLKTIDSEGKTCLHLAAENGDVNIVTFLIEQGAEIDKQDNHGNTPLMVATINEKVEVAKLLISKGANVKQSNFENFYMQNITPLSTAIRNALFAINLRTDIKMLEAFLPYLNDTNIARDAIKIHKTAHHTEIIDFLIDNNIMSKDDFNPLNKSILIGNYDLALHIIKKYPRFIHIQGKNGFPLEIAVKIGTMEFALILIQNGASFKEIEDFGKNLITMAIETELFSRIRSLENWDENIRTLINWGANINALDKSGFTALHHAIIKNDLTLIELLLNLNADPLIKKDDDLTPLVLANKLKNENVINLLLQKISENASKQEQEQN